MADATATAVTIVIRLVVFKAIIAVITAATHHTVDPSTQPNCSSPYLLQQQNQQPLIEGLRCRLRISRKSGHLFDYVGISP